MPRVLIVSTTTGYQTRAFGDAAAQLGVDLVFATDRCHMLDDPWRDQAVSVRFYDEPGSVAAILAVAKDRPVEGVIGVGDRPAVLAALAAEALGVRGSPPAAVRAASNKLLTRRALEHAQLPCPWFLPVPLDVDVERLARRVEWPVVVKPLSLAASRGVIRADDVPGLKSAVERLRRLLRLPELKAERDPAGDTILIEEFIPGPEFAVEGVLERGELQVLAVFDKPDPLDGPYFEETVYVTPSRCALGEQREIEWSVARAASALGLVEGPVHAECRVNETGVFVLEVAARPIGGLCSRALRFESGAGSGVQGAAPAAAADRVLRQAQHVLSLSKDECARQREWEWGPTSSKEGSGSSARVPRAPGAQDPVRGTIGPSVAVGAVTVSLEELLLRHALGESTRQFAREASASAVMMIPVPAEGLYRAVEGIDAAMAVAGVEDIVVTAKPGQRLVPFPEGASYPGFIFARAGAPDLAVAAVREAHRKLNFVLDQVVPVI